MRSTAAAVVSMLLLALGSFADASAIPSTFTLNGLKYVVTAANTVTVGTETTTACDPTCPVDGSGTLTIPSSVVNAGTTYDVTGIAGQAFMDQSSILSVTIPSSVTSIGIQAFYQSSLGGLTSLTLGSGVTTIGDLAFAGTAIQHLDIPHNVTTIGAAAFASAANLQTVEINGGSGSAHTIGVAAFNIENPGANSTLQYVRFRGTKPVIEDEAFLGHQDCQLRYPSTEPSWTAPFATMTGCTWNATGVPAIDQAPTPATVHVGDAAATFNVSASGNGELYYQWQKNGVDIPGATNPSLSIANPTLANNGELYRAVVTNWVGSTTSSSAALTVESAPPAPPAPTKSSQTAKISLAKKLKRNRTYVLPARTTQGQPIRWSASAIGKCSVKGNKLTCRKATGNRMVTLTARAPASSTLFAFVTRVSRKVG